MTKNLILLFLVSCTIRWKESAIIMKVNVEHLKADLKSECLGAYFGGGFGAALVSYSDVENASTEF